jgi:hypothetical protein
MTRILALLAFLPILFTAPPAFAATKAEKMETCKFGADNDKLAGKKRDAFIKRCMANGNYEPAARKDAMKKMKKKPAAPKSGAAPAPQTKKQ